MEDVLIRVQNLCGMLNQASFDETVDDVNAKLIRSDAEYRRLRDIVVDVVRAGEARQKRVEEFVKDYQALRNEVRRRPGGGSNPIPRDEASEPPQIAMLDQRGMGRGFGNTVEEHRRIMRS
jgi:hypothetical protein